MIILQDPACVFVHVRKTAGRSIAAALASAAGVDYGASWDPYSRTDTKNQHLTAPEIRALIGERAWQASLTFGVARDPMERLASYYRYGMGRKRWEKPFPTLAAFCRFATEPNPERARVFICEGSPWWGARQSQTAALEGVDVVLRFDRLGPGVESVFDALGLVLQDLPHLNASVLHEGTQVSARMEARVRRAFAADDRLARTGRGLDAEGRVTKDELVIV